MRLFLLERAQGAPDPLHLVRPLKSKAPRLPGHGGPQRPPGSGTQLSRQLLVPKTLSHR
jgi:hypothetical protein